MTIKRELQQKYYYGSVAEKLQYAAELHQEYAPIFLQDGKLNAEFEALREYAHLLNEQMTVMQMGELCVHCALNQGGGCCSLYMAGETDSVQLLMNMLSNIEVKQVRNDGLECCFLGENGCIFLFKPMFCLNYSCQKIYDAVSAESISELEDLTGQLLGKQYEIEKKLLERIRGLTENRV